MRGRRKALRTPGATQTRGILTLLVLPLAFGSALVLLALTYSVSPKAASASILPPGFREEVAIDGLRFPTAVEFSDDGRIFVAEKSGLIKVFDDLSDTTPTTFADLRTNVHNYRDRGLLGLALDPGFPNKPYVYVSYDHDAVIGGTAPRYGAPNATADPCPAAGCVTSTRLSRLQADGSAMMGDEQVLVEDWCNQYAVHSGGGLAFGADGALYVGAGEGASAGFLDYGQDGTPPNPCGDPPAGVGGAQSSPTAEGGSLRSQDLRTHGDPVGLGGTITRVDPDTGAAMSDNPLFSSTDPNARRVVAHGLRNPFRLTIRPGTNEVWVGDVGSAKWEEVNRVATPTSSVKNYGWPCYEGGSRHSGWDALDINICENLYDAPNAVTSPFFAYLHSEPVVAKESCPTANGSSVTGLAFYEGGGYPTEYNDSLFFADNSRDCVWVMFKGPNGLPDPATRATFLAGTQSVVDLQIGPGGDLFYVDLVGGEIRRVRYLSANRPPTAVAKGTPTSGMAPLEVAFDGTGSSDPDPGDILSYAWDLDGDGAYDDSSLRQPTYTYTAPGSYTAKLKVTDGQDASSVDSVVISAGNNSPPTATIEAPLPTTAWEANEVVGFSGSATDEQDGSLPASALSWELVLHHCPSDCHVHPVQEFPGLAGGEYVAPDHEYPAYLELRLTASDSEGLTDTEALRLDPKTVRLSFQTSPSGLELAVGDDSAPVPFTRTVIVGSRNSISAPSPQTLGGMTYQFASWSDGGVRSHDVIAGAEPGTYTATFEPAECTIVGTRANETLSGTAGPDVICGGGGNDVIIGLGGNDVLKGELGGDTLRGGEGDDTLDGGPGIDGASYYGSATAVTASLASGSATGQGSDTLVAVENLIGSSKNDLLTGSGETNALTGGGGTDTLRGGAGNDKVTGQGGADHLYGEDGNDAVNSKDGVKGNDSLDGGPGTDTKTTDSIEKSIVGFP